MMTLLVAMANPAFACPDDVAEASATVVDLRAAHKAARDAVQGTDWETKLALDDRDEVLADQAAATEALKAARVALRDAKRHLREVSHDADVACDPGPSTTKPG